MGIFMDNMDMPDHFGARAGSNTTELASLLALTTREDDQFRMASAATRTHDSRRCRR